METTTTAKHAWPIRSLGEIIDLFADRTELDGQIAKTFKATGAVSEGEGDECHAASGAHLRELLRGNHRYVFTLIHKFQTPELRRAARRCISTSRCGITR